MVVKSSSKDYKNAAGARRTKSGDISRWLAVGASKADARCDQVTLSYKIDKASYRFKRKPLTWKK